MPSAVAADGTAFANEIENECVIDRRKKVVRQADPTQIMPAADNVSVAASSNRRVIQFPHQRRKK
jgi:hypothetical protein